MRKRTRKKNGGKVIDSGGFGCVFRPALKCKTAKKRTKGISKLGSSEDVNIEWKQFTKIKGLLKKIPNYTDYFLLSDITICNPARLTSKDKENFNKCEALSRYGITVDTINQHLDEVKIINMPFGGINLELIITENIEPIVKINKLLQKLLINGILPMNKFKIYHFDIKAGNVLYNAGKIRLIDFGEVGVSIPSKVIPSELFDKGIQFNTPFSRLLFTSYFLQEISLFLKGNIFREKDNKFIFAIRRLLQKTYKSYINRYGQGHELFLSQILLKSLLLNINENLEFVTNTELDSILESLIINYCTKIVYTYTNLKTQTFELVKFFEEVYSENVDIYGFIMIYNPYCRAIGGNYMYPHHIRVRVSNMLIKYCLSTEYSVDKIPIRELMYDLKNITKEDLTKLNIDDLSIIK